MNKNNTIDTSTKKLLNGSMIYFVGNALTQLISLLLMRYVTGNITPSEYGFFNLVTTISNLVIPFITLQIADSIFRFVLKADEEEKKQYFTVGYAVMLCSVFIIIAGTFVLAMIVEIPHTPLVAVYVASYAVFGIYQKIVRCLNKNIVYVQGNLIKTVIFLLLEILLISTLDMGIEALLIANISSIAFFVIYAEIKVKAVKYINAKMFRFENFKRMMRFSIPLIPNAAFWWLTSSVNNVIVSAKLGVDVNGIYSVSGKFSGVLTMVTSVLNMSWQDTAIADYGNENFGRFFTQTFNTFVKLIFSAIVVINSLAYLLLPYMIAPAYYDAIKYTPFLLIISGVSTMSGFVAQVFVGKGDTKKVLYTSIFGMIANVAIVACLISEIGLWAAVLGSFAADFVLFSTRTFFARKEFAKGLDFRSFALVAVMLAIGIAIYFLGGVILNIVWLCISAAVAIVLNWQFLKNMITLLFARKSKA